MCVSTNAYTCRHVRPRQGVSRGGGHAAADPHAGAAAGLDLRRSRHATRGTRHAHTRLSTHVPTHAAWRLDTFPSLDPRSHCRPVSSAPTGVCQGRLGGQDAPASSGSAALRQRHGLLSHASPPAYPAPPDPRASRPQPASPRPAPAMQHVACSTGASMPLPLPSLTLPSPSHRTSSIGRFSSLASRQGQPRKA